MCCGVSYAQLIESMRFFEGMPEGSHCATRDADARRGALFTQSPTGNTGHESVRVVLPSLPRRSASLW
jgi:hypothetical protein